MNKSENNSQLGDAAKKYASSKISYLARFFMSPLVRVIMQLTFHPLFNLILHSFPHFFTLTFLCAFLQRHAFIHPARALVKVMSMTTGELDYDDIFHHREGEEEIAFLLISFPFWIIFLVMMPILLNNYLVRRMYNQLTLSAGIVNNYHSLK